MINMMFDDDVNTDLTCTNCGHPLSIFPINVDEGTDTHSCGRCTADALFNQPGAFTNPQRQSMYEKVARNLLFPCRYKRFGCVERHRPTEMTKHEISCEYKFIDCILPQANPCCWTGEIFEFYRHCKRDHVNYIFPTTGIEINLFLSPERDNIYLHTEHLAHFILNFSVDRKVQKFFYAVSSFNDAKCSFQLSFSVLTQEKYKSPFHQVELHGSIEKKWIALRNIQHALEDNLILTIKIIDNRIQSAESLRGPLNNKMLDAIECPICMLHMVPPIMQCDKGHIICSDCRSKCDCCPICRGTVSNTRNFALEEFTNVISYPCRNHDKNCRFMGTVKNIRNHENTCKYGPYLCPINCCSWEDKYSLIVNHMIENHANTYLNTDFVRFICEDNNAETYVTSCYGDIFKLSIKSDLENVYWAVQLLGPTEDADRYSFRLDLSGKNSVMLIKKNCGSLTEFNQSFDKGRPYIMFSRDMLADVLIGNVLTFNFRIVQN